MQKLTYYFQKVYKYGRGSMAMGKNDVVLASFPKSGNTWVRFFFCNLISIKELDGQTVDFNVLDSVMPELGKDPLWQPWPYKSLPRIVKSHQTYKPWLFRNVPAILVVRDPKDVMVSFYKYEEHRVNPRFKGTFGDFIRDDQVGLIAWFRHYQSWRNRATITLKYEDMKKGDVTAFSHIFDVLGLPYEHDWLAEAAKRSRFEQVKKVEEKSGISEPSKVQQSFRFARSGKMGEGKQWFNDDDLQLLAQLKQQYKVTLY